MRTKRAILFLGVAALFASFGLRASAQQQASPETKARNEMVGTQAPAIKVDHWINTSGKAFSLAGLRGKVVVLDYFAFW
jgi:cytochrome oxidase Cu insertion factor (SCO1/SenC/PrrC family)